METSHCVLSFVEVICWSFYWCFEGGMCMLGQAQTSAAFSCLNLKELAVKYRAFLCTLYWLQIGYLHLHGLGNSNGNFSFISTSLPACQLVELPDALNQILRSLMAERTPSVKPYLLVLLHKIMLDFICCRISLQTMKRLLSHCCDEVQ